MITEAVLRPPMRRRYVARPAALATVVLGAVLAFVATMATSWFSVSGPNVVHSVSELGRTNARSSVLIVSSRIGYHHSWVFWALLVVCVIAAGVGNLPGVPGKVGLASRVAALVLTALLLIDTILRIAIARLAIGASGVLPPGTTVHIGAGLWVALAGLVLIGVGTVVGPRRVVEI